MSSITRTMTGFREIIEMDSFRCCREIPSINCGVKGRVESSTSWPVNDSKVN